MIRMTVYKVDRAVADLKALQREAKKVPMAAARAAVQTVVSKHISPLYSAFQRMAQKLIKTLLQQLFVRIGASDAYHADHAADTYIRLQHAAAGPPHVYCTKPSTQYAGDDLALLVCDSDTLHTLLHAFNTRLLRHDAGADVNDNNNHRGIFAL